MRRQLLSLLAVLVVLVAGPALAVGAAGDSIVAQSDETTCDFPLEIEDATGETVVIEEEPEEVVVTAQNVNQHIWELGVEEKVVGMPHAFTEYLEGSQERTNVLDGMVLLTEEIVDLDPDLVLAPNATGSEDVATLRDLEQTVYHYPVATDLETVQDVVALTGQLLGACEAADTVTTEMAETIAHVEQAVSGEEQPSVFYDQGAFDGSVFTPADGTLEDDLIRTAGGSNIAAGAGSGYIPLNPEIIAAENPEWIVVGQGQAPAEISAVQDSTAVQEGQIIEVNPNFAGQHGPRSVDVLVSIAEALHPEALADAGEENGVDDGTDGTDDTDGTDGTDDTDGTDGTDDTDGVGDQNDADGTDDADDTDDADGVSDQNDTDDADDDGAGLTVIVAIAGLTALVVVARRQ